MSLFNPVSDDDKKKRKAILFAFRSADFLLQQERGNGPIRCPDKDEENQLTELVKTMKRESAFLEVLGGNDYTLKKHALTIVGYLPFKPISSVQPIVDLKKSALL